MNIDAGVAGRPSVSRDYDGIVSPAYVVLVRAPSAVLADFAYLAVLDRAAMVDQFYGMQASDHVSNLRLGTTSSAIAVAIPPVAEQAAIVRFLDHADRRIRRYIRAKQKLIKLLEEQKQAIIHRAVTRGLDPNVRLKPSGVEWLGDVPEHWERSARSGRRIVPTGEHARSDDRASTMAFRLPA